MSTNSKPVYLSAKKYPSLSSYDQNALIPESNRDPENAMEAEPQVESCIPSLNNKGKLTNFCLCFFLGSVVELTSFLSHEDNFMIWFIMGELLLFSGLLFYAKISEQIKHFNEKRRREIALLFMGGSGAVIFFRLIVGWSFLALGAYVATLVVYLLYARTYVVELNKWLGKYFKMIGFFD